MHSTIEKQETRSKQKDLKQQKSIQLQCCTNCKYFYHVESNKIAETYRCGIDQSIIIHPNISSIGCNRFSPKE